MEELALTTSMATLLMISVVCALIFKRMRMPAIIGYLAAGIIIANYWNSNDDETLKLIVDMLSNLGLALLMFTIGMELNLKKLKQTGAFALFAALVQLPILLVFGMLLGILMGWDYVMSICMGAIMAGSSTAVIVVVQKEKKVMSQDDVNTMILVLVVEDIIQVVLLSVLTPMIKSSTMNAADIAFLLIKIVLFMALAIGIGLKFIPRIVDWIGTNTNREVLLLTSLGLCFLMAMLAVRVGISMAVGAFLMGVIISQCRHRHIIESNVTPLKDVFMTMFFISVGLKVKPEDIIGNIPLVLLILVVFIVGRIVAGYLGYFLGDKDPRISMISATSRVTMGEFAFIISAMAFEAGAMSSTIYSAIIGAALISMILQPFVTGVTCPLYDGINSHLPPSVRRFNGNVTAHRDMMYVRFHNLSKKSAHGIRNAMTKTYVNTFIVFILASVFMQMHQDIANLYTMLHLGMSESTFFMLVEIAEFIVLLVPLIFTVTGLLVLYDNLMTGKADRKPTDDGEQFRGFMLKSVHLRSVVIAFLIDLVIIYFVPNKLGLFTDFLCAVAGTIILTIVWLYLRRPRKEKPAEDESELDDVPE